MNSPKRDNILAGVYLNLSKSGLSTTLDHPVISNKVEKKGFSIPNNSSSIGSRVESNRKTPFHTLINSKNNIPQNFQEIKSGSPETLTTQGLKGLGDALVKIFEEKESIRKEISKVLYWRGIYRFRSLLSYLFIFGFIFRYFQKKLKKTEEELSVLKDRLHSCSLFLNQEIDQDIEKKYEFVQDSFKRLSYCEAIWDLMGTSYHDKLQKESTEKSTLRKRVKIGIRSINFIKTKHQALHLENANGGDLYIYPAFTLIKGKRKELGLVEVKDLNISFAERHFVEEHFIPRDTQIIRYTWSKLQPDGEPDKKNKENIQLPVVVYGEINFKTITGLNETYLFSNVQKAKKFYESFKAFQDMLNLMKS
jgi:hypothetical protein